MQTRTAVSGLVIPARAALLTLVGIHGATEAAAITASTDDVVGDDGQCSLREAITAANADAASGAAPGECAADSGDDTIASSVAKAVRALGVGGGSSGSTQV